MAARTTSKTSTARLATKAATKPEPAASVGEVVAPRTILKKKDIVDRAVEISGVRKKDARPAAEAAIQTVLAALADGNEISFPPHGKIRIVKTRDVAGGRIITAKIRISTGAATIPAVAPLAETEE